jgi:hypothetical protein
MLNISKFTASKMAVCGLLMIGATGCMNEHVEAEHDFPEVSGQATNRFAEVQTANGARNDATLYPSHFSGGELNSLGIAKLDRMLQADEALTPVAVYVVAADKDEMTNGRKAAVAMYLKDAGLRDEQISVQTGTNPSAWSPSAPMLGSLKRTDSGDDAAETAAPAMPVLK